MPIGTSSLISGFCARPLASALICSAAAGSSVASPGANCDELRVLGAFEERAEQSERRGHDLDQYVLDDLPDDRPDPELRIVQRAVDRDVEIDHAVDVLEQRGRELDRQRHGLLARGRLAPFELIDADVMLGFELAILDQVLEVRRERALGDVVPGEASGIGVEHGQRNVLEFQADIGVPVEGEELNLARDRDGRELPDLTLEVHLG